MATQAESRLSRKIRESLEKEFVGSFWTKIHVSRYQSSGIPDILGWVQGIPFGLEVKMPGEQASKLQETIHRKMREAGCNVKVVENSEEAITYVWSIVSNYYHPLSS